MTPDQQKAERANLRTRRKFLRIKWWLERGERERFIAGMKMTSESTCGYCREYAPSGTSCAGRCPVIRECNVLKQCDDVLKILDDLHAEGR